MTGGRGAANRKNEHSIERESLAVCYNAGAVQEGFRTGSVY